MRLKLNVIERSGFLSILAALLICYGTSVLAAPGGIDQTFGLGGSLSFLLPGNNYYRIDRIAIQPTGKLLVGGTSDIGTTHRLFLRRHLSTGQLDTSFGLNGEAVEQISPGNYRNILVKDLSRIAVQADGKFLVGGLRLSDSGGELGVSVWRFTANGILDYTFDNDGRIDLELPSVVISPINSAVERIAFTKVPVSGVETTRILVVATFGNTLDYGIEFNTVATTSTLYRFDLNGRADGDFGVSGKVAMAGDMMDIGTWRPATSTTGDRIYVSGIGADMTATVHRYLADGTPDDTFGNRGRISIVDPVFGARKFERLLVQRDGRVLLSGDINATQGIIYTYVMQINDRGIFNYDFATYNIHYGRGSIVESATFNDELAIQSDNKFIVGRYAFTYRYSPEGIRDESYVTPLSGHEYKFFVLQADDKLVAVEKRRLFETNQTVYILRRLLAR